METREKTFVLRFSLSTTIPDGRWDDESFEENAWLGEWETQVKPGVVRAVFTHLRSFPGWSAHVRNRGLAPEDEIEIAIVREPDAPASR